MRVKCLNCEEMFDLDTNEYEEGDFVDCPECDETFIIEVKSGRFMLKLEHEKYDDYSLEEYYED